MGKIKILIVDDNSKKVGKVSHCISSSFSDVEVEISTALDIINAKIQLRDKVFDLLILDVQLPKRIGETINLIGGIDLLQEIKSDTRLNSPTHIVGLTEYESSLVEQKKEFDENVMSLVHFDEMETYWENQLKTLISSILKNKTQILNVSNLEYKYDIAILCALESPELEAILNLPIDWEQTENQYDDGALTYHFGTYQSKESGKLLKIVAASSYQMGLPAAAIHATQLIDSFIPKFLFMPGITGGVKEKVNYGDVIVADDCWDYGSGKTKIINSVRTIVPDPNPQRLDPKLNNQFKALARDSGRLAEIKGKFQGQTPDTSLKVHVGNLASGSSVVEDPTVVEEIMQHSRKLLGIEMEAYSVFLSAALSNKPKPQVAVVKSVCDFADSSKDDNYQHYAAYTSASVVFDFINKYV